MSHQPNAIKANFNSQPKFVRWFLIGIGVVLALLVLLLVFVPAPEPKVEAAASAPVATPAASPAARAAAFDRFDAEVRKYLSFSDAVVGTFRVNSAGRPSDLQLYGMLKDGRDLHRRAALDSIKVPKELANDADLAQIVDDLQTVYAVRASGFGYGMDFLDDHKLSDGEAMRDRLTRMDVKSKAIIAALDKTKASFSPR